MASMYVTIMDLPLFKGIGKEHVSNFLEKTNIEFTNFKSGETLYNQGDSCTHLMYIISGRVRFEHSQISKNCVLSEVLGSGTVVGADRLFGMNTTYRDTAIAETNVSMMRFGKSQYLNLLLSDEIYLFNYLNYLSLRAQRGTDSIGMLTSGTLLGILAFWLNTETETYADDIRICVKTADIQALTNLSPAKIKAELKTMSDSGLIECSDSMIKIRSRQKILELAEKATTA